MLLGAVAVVEEETVPLTFAVAVLLLPPPPAVAVGTFARTAAAMAAVELVLPMEVVDPGCS